MYVEDRSKHLIAVVEDVEDDQIHLRAVMLYVEDGKRTYTQS